MRGPVAWAARTLAALAGLFGVVWMLQGLGILPGSYMSGQIFWFWMGLAFVGVGGAIFWVTLRR